MLKKILPEQASKLMGCSVQFVRIGMQRGILQIGDAIQLTPNRWTYNIVPRKLAERQGITLEELERTLKEC